MKGQQLPSDFCKQLIKLDEHIRYVGLSDRSENVIMQEYKEGYQPLIPADVAEISFRHAAARMRERILLRPYIGKPLYVIAAYEKVKRATIPLEGQYFILMLSLDPDAEHEPIITEKVLPFLEKYKLIKRQ